MHNSLNYIPFEELDPTSSTLSTGSKPASNPTLNPNSTGSNTARSAETEGQELLTAFIARHRIQYSWDWFGPQLLAHLATYRLPTRENIDGRAFLNLNVLGKPREMGLWVLLTKTNRSDLLKSQCLPKHLNYCSLVPFYMAAQKKYNNVPYSAWDRDSAVVHMGATLHKAANFKIDKSVREKLSVPELISIREQGLRYSGGQRNPATYYSLTNISDTPLAGMPPLLKAMLTQIWCAHPANRNQYMILDPDDWDTMPEPLISTQLFSEPEKILPVGAYW